VSTREDEPAEAWLEAADGRRWPLQANCPIGRSPSNVIVLKDRKVSRRHAVVHRQDLHEFWLVDLGSGNGSYINELRASLPARLNDGDVMKLGDYALTFRQSKPDTASEMRTDNPSVTVIDVKKIDCWMLLADIVNSTKLASECDPSDWASLVGNWSGNCRQIVELHGGAINKYLGDGFLAIWPAKQQRVEHVTGVLKALFELQENSKLPFRLALHKGQVSTGGARTLGEDNLSGLELIMLFRMEKLAGSLGTPFLCTQAAHDRLVGRIPLKSAGSHIVEGYIDDEPRTFYCRADD
jgi:pSer/pThr/pTyr-binding forkhead associated (FHA) protein